jgi:alkaline phosphatase
MKDVLNKTLRKGLVLALLLFVALVGYAGGESESEALGLAPAGNAKYVFVFIGDGMGMPQISAAEAYLKATRSSEVGIEKLSFSDFPAQGLTTTYAEDRFITGSAASATAIACGKKTTIGTIAMDGSHTVEYETIAEMAKDLGMKVGIVSSVSIDHATPAAFYAHQPSRNNYYEIDLQMANSDFDYFAGGNPRFGKTPKGKPTVVEVIEQKGWIVADSRREFEALRPGMGRQILAYDTCFTGDTLVYDMDRQPENISLAEYTAKGIELLDNPNGFFMMVEGGKIDWACHANDGVSAIHDTFAFDAAVREAIKFYNKHPYETLIVVTGDHECGGLTLGYAGTEYETAFDVLDGQTVSYEYFDEYVLKPFKERNTLAGANTRDLLPVLEQYFGLKDFSDYELGLIENAFRESMLDEKKRSNNEETALLYGGYEPLTVTLTHILNRRAGLAWTSYKHTGVPVPTFALGAGASAFNGYYDNTDIFHKTVAAMGKFVALR